MSRIPGSMRLLYLALFTLFVSALTPSVTALAQSKEEMMTLEQLEVFLNDEGKGRDLSQATQEELAKLYPGGSWGKYVFKMGISTFILNLYIIFILAGIAIAVILFFFTPLGMFFFRGGLHAFVGSILHATGISKTFGKHLMEEPKNYLKHYGKVREAFAMYMQKSFIKRYKSNVTAIAFMGTAFLIFSIGLRGIKFVLAHEPGLIIYAIIVEVTVLLLLGLTTFYEPEEETDEDGDTPALKGKQLTLAEVERRFNQAIQDLKSSAQHEHEMRSR